MYYWVVLAAGTGEMAMQGGHPSEERARHKARRHIEQDRWYDDPSESYVIGVGRGTVDDVDADAVLRYGELYHRRAPRKDRGDLL